jgi:hypothetical protein
MRFFTGSVALVVLLVGSIVVASSYFGLVPHPTGDGSEQAGAGTGPSAPGGNVGEAPAPGERPEPAQAYRPAVTREPLVTLIRAGGLAHSLIIQGARVLPLERQEVPSERDGKILFLATPVPDDEFVPREKELRREVVVLGVEWKPGADLQRDPERKPAIKEPFEDPDSSLDTKTGRRKLYRLPRATDSLEPGTTKVVRLKLRFRKLSENDEVHEGQLLGVINPPIAVADMAAKESSVRAAEADVHATIATKEESIRRVKQYQKARTKVRGAITDDDYGAAVVTVEKYKQEEVSKKAAVVKAQQELSGAWTTLDLHVIRASIPGRIRSLYKQPGEAVKALDPVLQIQNTKKLRIESQVEVQDALPLQDRVKQAEALRAEARLKAKEQPQYAEKLS